MFKLVTRSLILFRTRHLFTFNFEGLLINKSEDCDIFCTSVLLTCKLVKKET